MATHVIMSRDELDETVLGEIAHACRVSVQDIEDVYACTPIQLGMMADYVKRDGTYVFRFVTALATHIDIDRYCAAIQTVVAREAVLRTRLVECVYGIVQVVLRETHHTYRAPPEVDIDTFIAQDRKRSMDLAEPLLRTSIIDRRLVVSTHHSISDQWTTIAMLEDVAKMYHGHTPTPRDPFKSFVDYCNNTIDQRAADQFWSGRLRGSPQAFPQIPFESYLPNPSQKMTHRIPLQRISAAISSMALLPSYIEAAWAWTVYNYTNNPNVSYGMVLSGRTPTANRQTMGPTLVSIPVSVNLKAEASIHELLKQRTRERRQIQSSAAMWYGLAKIRSINDETRQACKFQTLLNILLTGDVGYTTDELTVESKDAYAPFALCLMFHLTNKGSLVIDVNSDPDILDSQQVQRILKQFEHNLEHLVVGPPDMTLDRLPWLNSYDHAELLEWNQGLGDPLRECLHDRFIRNARQWPQRMAVECHDGRATYEELDRMTNRIAHDLKRKAIVVGSPVVFLFDKSFWTTAAVVSIVKAGGVCVPIDTEAPRERMQAIIDLSQAHLILTSPIWFQRCSALGWPEMIVLDRSYIDSLPEADADECPTTGVCPDDVAYLQFTSGSTGVPKGVLLEHRGLCYGQTKLSEPFGWEGNFRILQFASHAWNVCCLDTWGALRFGGTICTPSQDDRLSNLTGFIAAYKVTWALLTPTVIATLSPSDVPSLRTLISGGEPVDPKAALTWGSRLRFHNIWGPSESGWSMTLMHLHPQSRYTDTIGKPVGCGIWLTRPGKCDELAPIGSVGEILIEGAGVARGYAHNPEQSAAAFISPPRWAPRRSELIANARRFYRTGDWARYYPDGSIVFVGRGDNQVKIRGQRFELGEVDFVLSSCSSVRSVYSQVLTLDGGPKELIAVLSLSDESLPSINVMQELSGPDRDRATQHIQTVRQTVQEKLPSYMVPSAWFVVEKMPLAATCKLDRARIRKWLQDKHDLAKFAIRNLEILPVSGALTAPVTDTERILQTVWSSVLQIPETSIGRESSFIQLGGDSILAMLAASRCRRQGFALKAIMLLRNTSLAEAASSHMISLTTETADGAEQKTEEYNEHQSDFQPSSTDVVSAFGATPLQDFLDELGLREGEVEAIFPCLPLQTGILVSQMKGYGGEYMNRFAFKITPRLQEDGVDLTQVLLTAWQAVCDAQPILRTTFTSRIASDGGFHQIVLRQINVRDSTSIVRSSSSQAVTSGDMLREYARPSFRPGQVPHRLVVFTESGNSVYALLDISHALIDAKTMHLLRVELHRACSDLQIPLTRGSTLASYVAWIEHHRRPSQKYWRSYLADSQPCILARHPTLELSSQESEVRRNFDITFDGFGTLREFCKTHAITIGNVVQLTWGMVLKLITGAQMPCFGLTYSARDAVVGAQEAMGPFLSMLVCCLKLNLGDKIKTALENVRENTVEGMAHPACSISDVQNFLELGTSPLFDTLVVIVHLYDDDESSNNKYNIQPLLYEDPNEYPLGLKVGYTKNTLRTWLEYTPSRISNSLVSHVARTFTAVLKGIVSHDVDETLDTLIRFSNKSILSPPPFSFLQHTEINSIKKKAASQCEIPKALVEDILPCSPIQLKYMNQSVAKQDSNCWHSQIMTAETDADFDQLCFAFNVVEGAMPPLRTRIVSLQGYKGLLQVVHKSNPTWMEGDDLTEHLELAADVAVRYGGPLCRFGRIESADGSRHVVVSLHSAVYNEQMFTLMFESVDRAYNGSVAARTVSSGLLVDFMMHRGNRYVKGSDRPDFEEAARWPLLLSSIHGRETLQNTKKVSKVAISLKRPSGAVTETLLQAAWALCLAQRTGSSKVAFDIKRSGSDYLAVSGVEDLFDSISVEACCAVDVTQATTVESLGTLINESVSSCVTPACSDIGWDPVFDAQATSQISDSMLEIHVLPRYPKDSRLMTRRDTYTESKQMHHALQLECSIGTNETIIQATTSVDCPASQMQLLLQQYGFLISKMSSSDQKSSLAELEIISPSDISQLSMWNQAAPIAIEACVHDQFHAIAHQQPHQPAITSWDHGDLTYKQLDDLSSHLAHLLRRQGVQAETIVPLFCEKSALALVMMLGVLKAGGAILPLDATHPVERLTLIVRDCAAKLTVASQATRIIADKMPTASMIVSFEMLASIKDETQTPAALNPSATPSSACYVVYTSGSTGSPKGIVVCHRNVSTFSHHFRQRCGLTPDTRALHVFNFIFDGSMGDIFSVLLAGGTLCMPSEQQLLTDMGAAFRHFNANFASMTPTQSALFKPEDIQGVLKTLALGGEPLPLKVAETWAHHVRLINIYGPSETTIWSSTSDITFDGRVTDPRNIGHASGCRYWVVNSDDHNKLVPVGCPGELLIEGPLVARGYLNNSEGTAAVFFDMLPSWSSSLPSVEFSRQRFYKSGDLVVQQSDGSMMFLNRKDTQIKLRGQRIELAEIEARLDTSGWTVAVELIQPTGLEHQYAYIAVFYTTAADKESIAMSQDGQSNLLPPAPSETAAVRQRISGMLPGYMVPDVYFHLRNMPLTASGKTDRRQLKTMAQNMTLDQVATYNVVASHAWQDRTSSVDTRSSTNGHSISQVDDKAQQTLRHLWASVLPITAASIPASKSFFHLGGNSIAAIHLVAAARDKGYSLSVSQIFQHQTLKEQAKLLSPISSTDDRFTIKAFSLLNGPVDIVKGQAASMCSVAMSDIEDIFPCTPLQEGLIAMSYKRTGDYVAQLKIELTQGVDIGRLEQAWQCTIQHMPMLRTCIVDISDEPLMQVVLHHHAMHVTIHQHSSIEDALRVDSEHLSILGRVLNKLSLIRDTSQQGRIYLLWTAHHAIYDGWTLPGIFQTLEEAYQTNRVSKPWLPFQLFVKHSMKTVKTEAAAKYWNDQFVGLRAEPFPSLPAPTYKPRADSTLEFEIASLGKSEGGFTAATTIRSTWALLQASYTNSSEALFGAVMSGRQAKVPGIERVAGATIATVPLRIAFNVETTTVGQLLSAVQQQAIDMTDFEQTGLQNIQRASLEAAEACRFQTLLLVQPEKPHDLTIGGLYHEFQNRDASDADAFKNFSEYGLLLVCQQREQSLNLQFIFDSNVISQALVKRLGRQFEHLLGLVSSGNQILVSDMLSAGPHDSEDVWHWNSNMPPAVDSSVYDMIARTVIQQPAAPAVCAWDGELTYSELEELSSCLAVYLLDLGVDSEAVVPLCFEKSMWMPVAALAVMRIGAVSVAMDVTLPQDRLRAVSQQVQPAVLLTSAAQYGLAHELANGAPVVTVNRQSLKDRLNNVVPHGHKLPHVASSNTLYICFTSGSTGVPKGVQITQGNFSSALKYQAAAIGLTSQSRVFDFASYSVDMSWYNLLHALYAGACLCVPSHDERLHDISGAIRRLRANWICTTPTVASIIDDDALNQLQEMELFGELGNASLFSKLKKNQRRLRSAYGPTEATGLATGIDDADDHANIGRGVGCATWVVRSGFPYSLVPVGGVGELWIEGPLVGLGYLNDVEKTATAFVESPTWLTAGSEKQFGRQGRLYRTGDLVKYNEDGTITFLGRNDEQVKIRGQRVELLEVEHHLRRILREHARSTNIAEVIVEVITLQADGQKALAAFLVPDGAHSMTKEELTAAVAQSADILHAQLQDTLPRYMLPEAYIPLPKMPTASTSKRDRRQLREIGATHQMEKKYGLATFVVPPVNDIEVTLRQIWSDVLNFPCDKLSTQAKFFDLGGDSVAAMRVASRCRQNGINLSIQGLLELQTIQKLAAASEGSINRSPKHLDPVQKEAAHAARTIDSVSNLDSTKNVNGTDAPHDLNGSARPNGAHRANVHDMNCVHGVKLMNGWHSQDADKGDSSFELAPFQQFYFEVQHNKAGSFFVISKLVALPKSITHKDIDDGLRTLVSRHPMLRARYKKESQSGIWTQHISRNVNDSVLIRHVDGQDRDKINAHTVRCIESLNIESGPLLVAMVASPEAVSDTQLLFIAVHHVVVDLASMQILLKDLDTILSGRELSPLAPFSYRQWVISEAAHARAYLPPETALVSTTFVSPRLSYWNLNDQSIQQQRYAEHRLTIDSNLSKALRGLCNREFETQPVELVTAALMHSFKLSFPDRPLPPCFTIGLGRDTWDNKYDMSGTVGWFSHVAPVQLDETDVADLERAIASAKARTRNLPRRGASYFLSRYHHPAGKEAFKSGAHEVELNYQAGFDTDDHTATLLRSIEIPSEVVRSVVEHFVPWTVFAITVPPVSPSGELCFVFEYVTSSEIVKRWVERFEQSLRDIEVLARAKRDRGVGNQVVYA